MNNVKKKRESIKGIVDFALSQKEAFTIHDVYARFPGRESSIQPIVTVLSAAGMLVKFGRGEYQVSPEINSKMYARVRELEAKLEESNEEKLELGVFVNKVLVELKELRQFNLQYSEMTVQAKNDQERIRRLEAENRALRTRMESVKSQAS
jgi:hypothetical protein